MHKDQRRVKEIVLPLIAGRVYAGDPESVRDCIVLNRLLSQGPDPLYLMETCPGLFDGLCRRMRLDPAAGREAVEDAHWRGPGVLLSDGKGIPLDITPTHDRFEAMPSEWRREAVWLALASCSGSVEEGYREDTTVLERLRRAHLAAGRLADMLRTTSTLSLMADIIVALTRLQDATTYRLDERGHPHADGDFAFYMLYKQGFQCVAAHAPDGSVFWGTVPGTTLAEQGVTVDKEVSPQFGIVLPPQDAPT